LKERNKVREEEDEDVSSYWITLSKREDTRVLKEEALDSTTWRTHFGRGYRQTM
jgi:hypothetical protein